jgi:hypothetical protein
MAEAAAAAAAAIEEAAQQGAAHLEYGGDQNDGSYSHEASWDNEAATPQQAQQQQQRQDHEEVQEKDQLALQVVDAAEADAALFSTPDTTSTHSRSCYISNASGYEGSATVAGSVGSISPSQQQLQVLQPNCIEFSPIRGVALWADDAAAAAAAAAGMDTPGVCGSGASPQFSPAAAATDDDAHHQHVGSPAAGEEQGQESSSPEFSLLLQQQCAAKPCRLSPAPSGGSASTAGSPQFGWQRWQQQVHVTPAAAGSSSCRRSHTPGSTMQQQQAGSSSLLEQLLDESAESLQGLLQRSNSNSAECADATLSCAANSTSTPHTRQQLQKEGGQSYAPTVASISWLQALQQQQQPGSGVAGSPRAAPPSPAESVDSFVVAAAGEPYSSACFASSGKHCSSNSSGSKLAQHRRSQSWSAFEGLGSMLDATGAAATPATVACKDGWGPAAAAAVAGLESTSCRLFETPAGAVAGSASASAAPAAAGGRTRSAAAGDAAPGSRQGDGAAPQHRCSGDGAQSDAECDSTGEFVLFRAGGGGSMADLGLLNPVAVQDLADRLAAAELRATQQQQEVVKVGVRVSWLGRVETTGRGMAHAWVRCSAMLSISSVKHTTTNR